MENKMTGLDFKIREVAGRIRDLREVNGLSIEEMAQRTGLSVEEYIAHEEGKRNSPSRPLLYYMCTKNHTTKSEFVNKKVRHRWKYVVFQRTVTASCG